MRPLVVFGILGSVVDKGASPDRWERWRPTVAMCQHPDLIVHRLELLYHREHARLVRQVVDDVASVSPETHVNTHEIQIGDPWDFEEVFATLHGFMRGYNF